MFINYNCPKWFKNFDKMSFFYKIKFVDNNSLFKKKQA